MLSAVSRAEEGKASGVLNTIRQVGGVLGVTVLASVFSTVGGYGSPSAFVDGLTWVLWIGAAMVGLGAVTALAIPSHKVTRLRHVTPSNSSDLLIGGERSAPGILERLANGEINREEFERAGHPQTLPGGRCYRRRAKRPAATPAGWPSDHGANGPGCSPLSWSSLHPE